MTETQNPDQIAAGSEVAVTIAGRAIHVGRDGGVVVEYVKENGFADRIVVRPGPTVTIQGTAPPIRAELARRQHAARMVATSFLFEQEAADVGAVRDWVARWNELCPAGSPVLVRTGNGELRPATVAGLARTGDDGRAWVDVDSWGRQPLVAVLPAPDFEAVPA